MIRAIALITAAAAFGQTGIAPDQLRPATETPTQLWAGTASGFVPVRLGPGITVQKDASGFVISAAAATAPPSTIQVQPVVLAATNGAYQTTAQVILRNNVPQVEGIDFKRDAAGIVFVKPVTALDVIVGLKFVLQPG